jgi:hypothetical protein
MSHVGYVLRRRYSVMQYLNALANPALFSLWLLIHDYQLTGSGLTRIWCTGVNKSDCGK